MSLSFLGYFVRNALTGYTLCKSQRTAIIERDPLGVVLYGDVQDFTHHEKRHVLDGLDREAARYPWFRSSHWTASPFGALATLDMEGQFRDILTAPDRSETRQALADCVLDAMTHGARFASLDDILLDVVRDATWWPRIRRHALEVVHRHSEGKPGSDIRLKTILDEIGNGMVADPDDDLMGYLLTELYPRTVTAAALLDYFHAPKRRNYIGSYLAFWRHTLLEQSSDSDVSMLLDELIVRLDILRPIMNDHFFRNVADGLLERGLEAVGEFIDSARLYGWLGAGLDEYGFSHSGTGTQIDSIRSWLEIHPAIQKTIVGIGLDRCVETENFERCMHKVRGRLFHADPPADFGRWCLDRMRAAANDSVGRYLLQEAFATVCNQHGDAGLSLETLRDFADQDPKHKDWLSNMLVCPIDPEEREYIQKRRPREAEERKEKQEWLRVVKSHESELREGRAYPRLLHDLATAYFGHFVGSEGDTPTERLRNFLGNDEQLVESVFQGLRRSLERDDIPGVTDIIGLYTDGQSYLISSPFLAGLEEITQASQENVNQLSDEKIRQALAFRLTDGTGEDPDWYKSLFGSRPDLVAEVLTAYVIAAFRRKEQHITCLYALACVDDHNAVARLASLAMLNAFPARSTNQQHTSLDELLKAALSHSDRRKLLWLIEKKLNLHSMNVGQRVRWLAAGLIVAPKEYMELLADFTEGQEKRVQHLASFLADERDQYVPLDDLPVPALGLLVNLIGRFFAPYELKESGFVSQGMNTADFVNRLISRLGSHSGKEATDVLYTLSMDPGLNRWQNAVRRAQFEQSAARREASFRRPDIRQVSETLNNRAPANAGDLAALTTVVLRDLANQIRNGNTDDYRQYWNEGPQRQLESPKHEEACRNALLSDLQQRIAPFQIDAQPEGRYADDKRADIRVAFGGTDGFEVPIEIKKNSHRNLWRAIHEQLIAKYTRAPDAAGFGIYLVFWFGSDNTQPSASEPPPRTADELGQRLRATLSVDENRKISVCVIDVAKSG